MKISVNRLTKTYDTQRAVDEISFEVNKGEIVGFLGPNGAGKTTTMKIITCFIEPTSGTVKVGDLDIANDSLEIRKRIGYLPENNPLYLDMYVHEYLHFAGRMHGLKGLKLEARAQQMIDMTGLQREQHKKIRMLSKGYRQRVGLAQALIHDPEILILDEPTSGLDPNQIIEIRSLIQSISKEKTIMFSTHILSEVEAISDRVIIINRGKIVADEPIAQIQAASEDQNILIVQFENQGFDWSKLQSVEGFVSQIEEKDHTFMVTTEKQLDIRKALFEESVKQNNPIFMLQKKEHKLEDTFRKLTSAKEKELTTGV